MIKLVRRDLSPTMETHLQDLQRPIDASTDYSDRCRIAGADWTAWRPANRQPVRTLLKEMAPGICRCMFCMDSSGEEIEHFRPQAIFPSYTFKWSNMFLICGACNKHKLSQFPLCSPHLGLLEKREDLKRAINAYPTTEHLSAILLNPIEDDPSTFLELDIAGGTFRIVPRPGLNESDQFRATETIRVLKLNSRDVLPRIRSISYRLAKQSLELAVHQLGADRNRSLDRLRTSLSELHNQFVWAEMQRQSRRIFELNQLFGQLPDEVRAWPLHPTAP